MYKTVDFNIFRENLERLVYGDDRGREMRENLRRETERQKPTERNTVRLRPLTDERRHEDFKEIG